MHLFWLQRFLKIYFSQGSVVTQLRCGGVFNNRFTASCPQSALVKEILKSVNTWRKYKQKYGGRFFDSRHIDTKIGIFRRDYPIHK